MCGYSLYFSWFSGSHRCSCIKQHFVLFLLLYPECLKLWVMKKNIWSSEWRKLKRFDSEGWRSQQMRNWSHTTLKRCTFFSQHLTLCLCVVCVCLYVCFSGVYHGPLDSVSLTIFDNINYFGEESDIKYSKNKIEESYCILHSHSLSLKPKKENQQN